MAGSERGVAPGLVRSGVPAMATIRQPRRRSPTPVSRPPPRRRDALPQYNAVPMTAPRSRKASAIARSGGLLALVATLAFPALAAEQAPEIRAVAVVVRPLVVEEGGHLTGFSIDLWNEVAARLKVKTRSRVVPDVDALFGALRANEADVAISGAFYSAERDREFDFTYPILNSGLQVMVRGTGESASDRPLRGFLKVLLSGGMIYWLASALLLVLVPAHVIWWLDRRSKDGVSPTEKYFPGIFYAMAWAAEALLSQAMLVPKHRWAHLLAILWMFAGVVFVAFFTAQLTATVTVEQIRGAINGPEDLPGKEVGTIGGSPSAAYLRGIGANVRPFTRDDEMYAALLSGQVDAVLWAATTLRYHAAHGGLGKVKMVGPEFKRGNIGFVVAMNSPLRKKISTELLALYEDGTYQRIYEKWFGRE